ncbi:MAG: heavy metal efflux system protein [Gammaproteobacteria bacterium]|nr:heavy metal efflux system protein [Gammaproteobacteria bacterium]
MFESWSGRDIPVKFSVRGRDLGSTVAEVQERMARNVKFPRGYRLEWAGEFQDLQLAKQRLLVFVPMSLGLILILLYSLFNSVRDSLLALAGIPFAIGGGLIALFVTGLPFSVSAAIGFISLFGVSVMNGILVISYFNQLRAQAMPPVDAMRQAAEKRMRPMLMTALSACIGLVPAAFSSGIGSQVQRPLATVVVGGMLNRGMKGPAIVFALWLSVAVSMDAGAAVSPKRDGTSATAPRGQSAKASTRPTAIRGATATPGATATRGAMATRGATATPGATATHGAMATRGAIGGNVLPRPRGYSPAAAPT